MIWCDLPNIMLHIYIIVLRCVLYLFICLQNAGKFCDVPHHRQHYVHHGVLLVAAQLLHGRQGVKTYRLFSNENLESTLNGG